MNIKILSDSTCDLSPEQLKEHDIELARLTVIKDGEGFVDGLTITPADIFAAATFAPPPPITSAITMRCLPSTALNMTALSTLPSAPASLPATRMLVWQRRIIPTFVSSTL